MYVTWYVWIIILFQAYILSHANIKYHNLEHCQESFSLCIYPSIQWYSNNQLICFFTSMQHSYYKIMYLLITIALEKDSIKEILITITFKQEHFKTLTSNNTKLWNIQQQFKTDSFFFILRYILASRVYSNRTYSEKPADQDPYCLQIKQALRKFKTNSISLVVASMQAEWILIIWLPKCQPTRIPAAPKTHHLLSMDTNSNSRHIIFKISVYYFKIPVSKQGEFWSADLAEASWSWSTLLSKHTTWLSMVKLKFQLKFKTDSISFIKKIPVYFYVYEVYAALEIMIGNYKYLKLWIHVLWQTKKTFSEARINIRNKYGFHTFTFFRLPGILNALE